MLHMKQKQKNEINVRKLIIVLIVVDVIAAGFAIHYKNRIKNQEPQETAAVTAPAATAEPSVLPSAEPSAEPVQAMLQMAYPIQSYAPMTPDSTTGFKSSWYVNTVDGYVNNTNTFDTDTLDIINAGSTYENTVFYRDGLPYSAGAGYTVYFNASSTVDRTITVQAVNNDTGTIFSSMDCALTSERTFFTFAFTPSETTFSGRLQFLLGKSANTDNEHTVTIDNIRITNDLNVEAVRINQVGYPASMQKRCTFLYNAGDLFDVVDADTNAIAYSGAIVNEMANADTGETNCYGDFTNLTKPGNYYIRAQIGVVSPVFTISEDPYAGLQKDLIHMLSLQRCGSTLDASWAGAFAHDTCHTGMATVLYMQDSYDVSGGWHDAGDYGRYVKTGAKAASDLLLAYLRNPDAYGDDTNGPESGNGVPDILDEARYELEWLMKMQRDDGGVNARAVTQSFAYDGVAPAMDDQALILFPEESASTAFHAGTMAMASIAFQTVDPDFAQKCLGSAERAETYLQKNSDNFFVKNPDDFSAGQYLDDDDKDGRFYAEAALYAATGKDDYRNRAKNLYIQDSKCANGVSWRQNGGYGRFLILCTPHLQENDPDFYNALLESLRSEAEGLMGWVNGNGYNVSLDEYTWGSNQKAADNGTILAMAYSCTGEQKYLQAAGEQAAYLLGKNSLDFCFVSGYGKSSPTDLHSRIARAAGTNLPGALAGGPDASREDTVTQQISWDVPSAKVYADSYNSYSTNEAAIYYNSALISLIGNLK